MDTITIEIEATEAETLLKLLQIAHRSFSQSDCKWFLEYYMQVCKDIIYELELALFRLREKKRNEENKESED